MMEKCEIKIVSLHPKINFKMTRIRLFLDQLIHYKYHITVCLGLTLVGFADEYSFMNRLKLDMQISEMEEEIERYSAQNEKDIKVLQELRHNPAAYEKIARERYFMKTEDEDIFVLSDDKKTTTKDETDE